MAVSSARLLLPSPKMAPFLSYLRTFSQVPSALASPSSAHGILLPTHGTLLLSPLGCLHTANPSPLPGTDLQSLSLSAQPPPECFRLWCLGNIADDPCHSHSAFPSSFQLLHFSRQL